MVVTERHTESAEKLKTIEKSAKPLGELVTVVDFTKPASVQLVPNETPQQDSNKPLDLDSVVKESKFPFALTPATFIKLIDQDPPTWESFVNATRDTLVTFAKSKGLPFEEAEQVVQDTYAKFNEKLPSLDDRNRKSYFMTILANKCRDYRRRQKNRAKIYAGSIDNPCFIDPDDALYVLGNGRPPYARSAEDTVFHDRDYERLGQAVRRLTPLQQVTILLSIYELSNREIAELLGIEEGAVKARLNKARVNIKKSLKSETA